MSILAEMSGYNQFKHLKEEVQRLIDKGLNKDAVFDCLHAEELFADVSRNEIHAIYEHLMEKARVESKVKAKLNRKATKHRSRIEEQNNQIAELQDQLANLKNQVAKHQIAEHDDQITEFRRQIINLKAEIKHQTDEYKNQIDGFKHLIGNLQIKEEHMMAELDCMRKYHQKAENSLIYNESVDKTFDSIDIWQSRYFLTVEDENGVDGKHKIKILDLFQNTSK